MSKGPRITPEAKLAIYQEALKEPRRPRTNVAVTLERVMPEMGYFVPERDVLLRMISWARNHEVTDIPENELWGLTPLATCPISPEALPSVLVAWFQAASHGIRFTYRDAKWVALLYSLYPSPEVTAWLVKFPMQKRFMSTLWGVTLAQCERAAVAANVDRRVWDNPVILLAIYEQSDLGTVSEADRKKIMGQVLEEPGDTKELEELFREINKVIRQGRKAEADPP